METVKENPRETPVLLKTDVVVAGGGTAGLVAAVAAARNGASVVLVELENFVGGLLACLPILGFYNYQGEQAIFGTAEELVQRLMRRGACPGHVPDPRLSSVTPTDSEVLKIVAQEMIEEAGAKVLFHSMAVAPYMEGKTVKGVFVENKSGRSAILAKAVIDCTGDGDIAARAGADYSILDSGGIQPGTLMFRMDHVNLDKVLLAVALNPDNARTNKGHGPGAEYFLNAKRFNLDGFTDQLAEARQKGDIPPDYPMRWVILQPCAREDEVLINMAMATHFIASEGMDLTRAEMEARRRIPVVVDFLKKYIPGFDKAQLVASHSTIGVRESRRILGDAALEADDVTNGRRHPDGVAIATWPLSAGHHPEGRFREKEYELKYPKQGLKGCQVRYGCLLPKGIDGLLTAGRCISTTELTLNAIRVMAPCMSIGQAAGTAAALAVKQNLPPRKLDVAELRAALVRQGVRL